MQRYDIHYRVFRCLTSKEDCCGSREAAAKGSPALCLLSSGDRSINVGAVLQQQLVVVVMVVLVGLWASQHQKNAVCGGPLLVGADSIWPGRYWSKNVWARDMWASWAGRMYKPMLR